MRRPWNTSYTKGWPDQRLEDREQILAERVGLLPEEHKRADQGLDP
jgi:hypothetical protein